MGDQDDRALVVAQRREDLLARGRVKVVGGFVQEKDVGARHDEGRQREAGLLSARKNVHRFIDVITLEQELTEDVAHVRVVESGSGVGHILSNGALLVEGLVLLGIVAELEPVPGDDGTRVRFLHPGKQAQKRRLSGAVKPQDDDLGTAVNRQVDTREHLERPIGL